MVHTVVEKMMVLGVKPIKLHSTLYLITPCLCVGTTSSLCFQTLEETETWMFCCWDTRFIVTILNLFLNDQWLATVGWMWQIKGLILQQICFFFSYTTTTGWRPPPPSALLPSWTRPSQRVGTATLSRTCVTAPSCSSPFTSSLRVQRAAPLEKVAVKYSDLFWFASVKSFCLL